ncbi:hypothetical protein LJB99_02975 [Deltaproteobacteria bacterium OttesenSCG-928-K17]|nr:hypothetical protein [Deltaproteobacteria bacterium OttesenSCG-928-K17]
MIFCAGGDPGGSRALIPVIEELARRGRNCAILDHGFLGREMPPAAGLRLVAADRAEEAAAACDLYLFGSSAADIRPLSLARLAKGRGRPVVHVLDNWSAYAHRLKMDGQDMLAADLYAVMDQSAAQGAAAEGVEEKSIKVTGHPGLAAAAKVLSSLGAAGPLPAARQLGLPENRLLLVFINEPLGAVLGRDLAAPGHYGFTEDQVLSALTAALRPFRDEIFLILLPHPKDDPGQLEDLWAEHGHGLDGVRMRLAEGRAILPAVHAAAGMASILLYEAWLCGLPALSLQPGARSQAVRRFAALEDICYAGSETEIPAAAKLWLSRARGAETRRPRPELAVHAAAPATVADEIEKLLVR